MDLSVASRDSARWALHMAEQLQRWREEVVSYHSRFAVVLFRNTPSPVWNPLRAALAEARVEPVWDLWPVLSAGDGWRGLVQDSLRDWRPNERAHRLVASQVADFLFRSGLLR